MLAPAAAVYGAIAARRMARSGTRAAVPVICIGNLTLGGAGKTPTAIQIVKLLREAGESPVLLTRGYGGRLAGPVRVDPKQHTSADVGDEPLLLARAAPTIVSRDRATGASLAAREGASVIVMDDGFQNPALEKDLSILVLDARRGIGNACVFPAGPLRAPLDAQLKRADGLLVIGGDAGADNVVRHGRTLGLSIFQGRLAPAPGFAMGLKERRVLAFAGIGDPEKFYATLEALGAFVVERRSFPDHHVYSRLEAADLVNDAQRLDLALVTTEKDAARFAGHREASALAARALALPVTLTLDEEADFHGFVMERVSAARDRIRS